jgi:Mor family transcriptional regulator
MSTEPDDIRTLPALLAAVLSAPEFGLPPLLAENLASAVCRIAAARIGGGCEYYLPHIADRPTRNQSIRKEYTGHNVTALARRYGVSRRQLYRIVKRENSDV